MEFGETPEKWVTVVQPTTNKSIYNWHRCIMSQELPNISKIPQMNEAAFTNILDMFREGKIWVKPHTQVPDWLGGVKGVAQDVNWETCIWPFSLFLGAYKYELSFIRIEFELDSRHLFFDILKAHVQLIKSSCVTDGHKVGCHRHRNGSLHLCVYQSVY